MPNKKETNFTHKRELRLNQERFYKMDNEKGNKRMQQDKSVEQAIYMEQLSKQINEYAQIVEEQTQLIETQKQEIEAYKQELDKYKQEFEEQKQEIEEQKQMIEVERQKAEESNELYLRARADAENTRRRARNEKEQALKYAVVPLFESLLPVLDNFERAMQAVDSTDEHTRTLKEGVEMVYRHFLQVLSESGLNRIEAEGQPFDPHLHNAVKVEEAGVESGIVVEELQTGYRYLDRIVRPTMVKVSK